MAASAYEQKQVLTTLLVGVALLAIAVATAGAYALVADTLLTLLMVAIAAARHIRLAFRLQPVEALG